TLEPLWPRYVSMVDSGNLLGDLWALEQGFEELLSGPLLGLTALKGLKDTLGLLRQLPAMKGIQGTPRERPLAALETLADSAPSDLEGIVRSIRATATPACLLVRVVNEACPNDEACLYWIQQVERQTALWNEIIDGYLAWVEILASP